MNNRNLHELLGSSRNLPSRQQNSFDHRQNNSKHAPPPTEGQRANWWDKDQESESSSSLFSSYSDSKKGDEESSSGSLSSSSDVAVSTRNRRNVQKVIGIIEKAPQKVNPRRMSISDDSGLGEYQPNRVPLINLDKKSPVIWGVGCILIYFIIFVCSIIQSKGFVAFSVNPFFGPDESTLLLFGAKQGSLILRGDWWRFFTAIFVHSGLIHILLSLLFMIQTNEVEKETGFWRTVIVFCSSGVYGYVLSSLLIPNVISNGPTGALFGFVGLQIADLISSWRMMNSPCQKLSRFVFTSMVCIIIGLTPFLDNFMHIGGFFMGFLTALMLLPNLSFDIWDQKCHGVIAFLAFPLWSTVFVFSIVVFFRSISSGSQWCSWCQYLNCVNVTGWCENLGDNVDSSVVYLV